MMDKEAVARQMHGAGYDNLSAWAQAEVDHVIEALEGIKVNAPHNTDLRQVNSAADQQRMATRIRVLEEENGELWEENGNLRAENAQLRQELNLPEDSSL